MVAGGGGPQTQARSSKAKRKVGRHRGAAGVFGGCRWGDVTSVLRPLRVAVGRGWRMVPGRPSQRSRQVPNQVRGRAGQGALALLTSPDDGLAHGHTSRPRACATSCTLTRAPRACVWHGLGKPHAKQPHYLNLAPGALADVCARSDSRPVVRQHLQALLCRNNGVQPTRRDRRFHPRDGMAVGCVAVRLPAK